MKKTHPCVKTSPGHSLFLLVLLSSYFSCRSSKTTVRPQIQCIPEEREALLNFNKGIEADNCGLLTSWTAQDTNQDCCQWHGIRCNNHTGHVIMLDLRGKGRGSEFIDACLKGNVSPSLFELEHLEYLDLSSNDFKGHPIPSLIGSLRSLKYLNLSHAGFGGEIPPQLANLSSLTSLDLSANYDIYARPYVHSLEWISRLTLLRNIDLSGIDLNKATDWMHSVNNLPHLRVLHMERCYLPSPNLSSLSYANSTSNLRILSLPQNFFNDAQIIGWMFNLTRSPHLEHVDLSNNYLTGPVPIDFQTLSSLSYLDLSNNKLEGPIPNALFRKMQGVSYLDLSGNSFNGSIPDGLALLPQLVSLDLSGSIPPQLANFSIKAFDWNLDLCGEPIPWYWCPQLEAGDERLSEESEKGFYIGLYVSIAIGFYMGFCIFFGTLALKESWRRRYFQFLDHIINWVCVTNIRGRLCEVASSVAEQSSVN